MAEADHDGEYRVESYEIDCPACGGQMRPADPARNVCQWCDS